MVKYPQKKVTAQRAGKGKQNKRCACLRQSKEQSADYGVRSRKKYGWITCDYPGRIPAAADEGNGRIKLKDQVFVIAASMAGRAEALGS